MSPHIKRAHERMLAVLPSRRHEWQPVLRMQGQRREPMEEAELKRRLAEAEALGWTRKRMEAEFCCNNRTIIKLIGKQK